MNLTNAGIYKIFFRGRDYLFIGNPLCDGAIAEPDDYHNFLPSFAHLFPDGEIKRYNRVIGTRKDIAFLEKIDSQEEGK